MRPLAGIRIADFSSNIAGPYAAMILAQLGADVIKIESLQGDDSRAWPPVVDGLSLTHRHMGAGKRGLALDLKQPQAVQVALDLIATCHVVLQSMRPGVSDRIGIGFDAVHARNPQVLYYDLSAFGDGPQGQGMPGYDPLVQAFSGIVQMNGHEGMPATRCAPSLIDLGTGQWVAMGIMAAIMSSMQGQPIARMNTALLDTAFSVVPYQASAARMTGQRPPKAGSGNPIAAPYQCYEAQDGMLMIAAPSQRLWQSVLAVLEAPELGQDERFASVAARSVHRQDLEQELNLRLRQRPLRDWLARFSKAGVPVAQVSGLEQAVVSDLAQERGTFIDSAGVPLVRLPWLVDGQPLPWVRPAPHLGEHSLEILGELKYNPEQQQVLLACGAVYQRA